MMREVVIVGGSIAAVTAADALRQQGHDGPITIVSDERHAPYVRPPLSKGMLKGTESVDSVFMAPLRADLDFRPKTRARGLDLGRRRVLLEGGEELPYDGLVVASGARARRLGPPEAGELVVRDLDDALRLREIFATARSVVIVGGGFLGMEIASTARGLGLDVTVVDRDPPLVRQFGAFLAGHMTRAALAAGVRLVRAPEGVRLAGTPATAVLTGEGAPLEADVIVTAAGDLPNVEWLAGSGVGDPGGLLVDERCRVAPGVVAAGDVVARVADHTGLPRRSPHWGSAIDQARAAAQALLKGDEAPEYRPSPYYWTEQWGLDIKICGRILPGCETHVVTGSMEEGSALLQWTRDGATVAAATVNHRMPVVKLRKLAAAPVPERTTG
ncbi:NADPH-dependent 2,4-dienoyl-CoA reductase/sulfur reductase-like enzyme [Sphaerisporangium siamense]|uniref:NADPH-dependent 2,4-dienoyl-CoA reductase/sulfur reductase-like enzyme n=2 Tax=Sphaerisporangium siamense TaxID=795645 RepID=A0A7W7GBX1_9ACTN|nr:NADPH-dependent 2,4-dienoyl-CoA reductase/sulfur reductase-like enzyme [Sphaerisporangium siamense]